MEPLERSDVEDLRTRAAGQAEFDDVRGIVPTNDLLSSAADQAQSAASPVADPMEDPRIRRVPFADGYFEIDDSGVWYRSQPEAPRFLVCDHLVAIAFTRDEFGQEWRLVLQWSDADRKVKQWAMPLEKLAGQGIDVLRELLRRGLRVGPSRSARALLVAYLASMHPTTRMRCVSRGGWWNGVFVLPHMTIGPGSSDICYESSSPVESPFSQRGTLVEWRDGVPALAAGNSRLVFALSAAFAGSLLDLVGEEGGVFHFRGQSSSGKTSALWVASSVWGNPSVYVYQWRSTANALESIAFLHNDGFLGLDEIGQLDPHEAGTVAYMLANGRAKSRASGKGTARNPVRWRLLALSNGEQSLPSLATESGKRIGSGQEIRFADIDADAGAGMGVVENLHGFASPSELIDTIKCRAMRFYGVAGIEWLQHLTSDREAIAARASADVATIAARLDAASVSGPTQRVARRFAVVAVAGEIATKCGLTGWGEGEATEAAECCYKSWIGGFGHSEKHRDEVAILEHVRGFLESHGPTRFQRWETGDTQKVSNRLGFWRDEHGLRRYYVFTAAFKQTLCAGFEPRDVVRVLKTAGVLEVDNQGKNTQKTRLPCGIGPARCYVVTSKIWEADE